jgi:hypothetical protein
MPAALKLAIATTMLDIMCFSPLGSRFLYVFANSRGVDCTALALSSPGVYGVMIIMHYKTETQYQKIERDGSGGPIIIGRILPALHFGCVHTLLPCASASPPNTKKRSAKTLQRSRFT